MMDMKVFVIVQLIFIIGTMPYRVAPLAHQIAVQDQSFDTGADTLRNESEKDHNTTADNEDYVNITSTHAPIQEDVTVSREDTEGEHSAIPTDAGQSTRRGEQTHRRRHSGRVRSKSVDDNSQASTTLPNADPIPQDNQQDDSIRGNGGQTIIAETTDRTPEKVTHINNDFPTKTKTTDQIRAQTDKINGQKTSKYVSSGCPKCTRVEQEKHLRAEEVKATILKRLGLSAVPKLNGPVHPLPFDFYLDDAFTMSDQGKDEEEEEDTHSVKTKEIFIFGKDVTEQCVQKKGTGCYSFNLTSQNIDPLAVASVELWVYKQTDLNDHYIQTFMVSELSKHVRDGSEVLRSRTVIKRLETRLKYGWMKVYVKRTVLRWLSKPHRNNGLAITCQTCKRRSHRTIYGDKEGLMPILVFYMKSQLPKRRIKRSVSCNEGGNNCCHREFLEINFSDIGWDYIMAPLSIRPNYCIGSCNGIQAAHYNHTRLTQTLKQTMAYNHLNIQPCCSPVSFRHPQSLIYRDNNNVVRKVDVPDLIVGECGCA